MRVTKSRRGGPVIVIALVAIIATVAVSAAVLHQPQARTHGADITPTKSAAPVSQGSTLTSTRLNSLKLLNYYPSDAAWSSMWERWDIGTIQRDIRTMAALHANAVRLIVQTTTFGYPNPNPQMLERLAATVEAARTGGLRVQLTLFDWWSAYTDLTGSTTWATAVLKPYANSPEIAFVELKNEIDPTNNHAMRWARTELPVIKKLVGTVPVTVSVTGSDTAAQLAKLKSGLGTAQPDFYDIHYYGAPGAAYAQLSLDKAIASPAPLFVGETGLSTAPPPGSDLAEAEANQDHYLRTVEWATQALGLPPAAPWMLYDLAPGAIPRQSLAQSVAAGTQSHFGLLRVDSSEKPAAASISDFFATGIIDTTFNNAFNQHGRGQPLVWQTVGATAGTLYWDSAFSHSGGGSVALARTGGTSTLTPSYRVHPVVVPTAAGQLFALAAWAKGTSTTGRNRMSIAWFASTGLYLGNVQSPSLAAGTTLWTRLMVQSRVPVGTAYAEVDLESSQNTGTVWFDDVTFTRVP